MVDWATFINSFTNFVSACMRISVDTLSMGTRSLDFNQEEEDGVDGVDDDGGEEGGGLGLLDVHMNG